MALATCLPVAEQRTRSSWPCCVNSLEKNKGICIMRWLLFLSELQHDYIIPFHQGHESHAQPQSSRHRSNLDTLRFWWIYKSLKVSKKNCTKSYKSHLSVLCLLLRAYFLNSHRYSKPSSAETKSSAIGPSKNLAPIKRRSEMSCSGQCLEKQVERRIPIPQTTKLNLTCVCLNILLHWRNNNC